MADYTSGAIYFTGLGTGTDFDSIIEATIAGASYRLETMEGKQATYETEQAYLQELNSATLELSTLLKTMDSVSDFLVKQATTTASDLGAVADGDASVGSHSVTVNQLAQTDVWVNTATGETSATAAITASNASFSYSYDGQEYTLDVAAGTTLQGLASLITSNDEGDGDVRAAIINDGDGYHLKIYGMDQGADHAVTITGSTIDGYAAADFENTQTAQNAQLKVDGYPPGTDDWIERTTNSIDDVIDGVTLTLHDTVTDARVNVTLDSDSIKENIETLVESLNTVFSYIDALTSVDGDSLRATFTGNGALTPEEEDGGSTFTGNYGVRLAEQLLKQAASSQPAGFDYYDASTGLGDLYSALSQIGITTDAESGSETFGLLVIDDEELDKALAEDPESVALLLAADGEGESLSDDFSYVSSVSGITEGGEYEISYEISGGSIVSATIDGKEAILEGLEITASGDTPAAGLTVRVDNLADGTYSGTALVKQGVIPLLEQVTSNLTSSDNGLFTIMDDSYDEKLKNLTKRIEDEQDRLETMESELRERYASLEAMLGEYDDISDQLDSSLAELSSSS